MPRLPDNEQRAIRFLMACVRDVGTLAVLGALVLAALANSIVLLFPFTSALLFQRAAARDGWTDAVLIVLPLAGWAGFGLLSGHANSRILQELRAVSKLRLYGAVLAKPRSFFVDTAVGSLESLLESASFAVRHLFFESAAALSRAAGTVFATAVAVLFTAPGFLPVFLVWAAGFLALSVCFATRSVRHVAAAVHSSAAVSAHLADTFLNVELVKNANAERREIALLREKVAVEERTYHRAQCDIENATAMQRWLIVLIIFTAATGAFTSTAPQETASAAPLLVMLLFASMQIEAFGRSVTGLLEYFGRLVAALDTLRVDGAASATPGGSQSHSHPLLRGEIDIQDLAFGYGADGLALANVSVRIKAGEKVGIVGRSGAGKSTLVRLIRGHLTPTSGAILIDGIDTRDLAPHELGRAVAFISQETMVFHRSLAENICYGLPPTDGEDQARLRQVITAAGLDGVAARIGGAGGLIGERGLAMSGGERQRIALARALLSSACIVILDEATSAIDIESERTVHRALFEHFADKTIIVISHRPSSLAGVERLLHLNDGRLTRDMKPALTPPLLPAARRRAKAKRLS